MSSSPLTGVTVVDLSRLLPGPLASRLLRDLGARVIKIEEPALGDPVRQAPPFRSGTSALAALLLAGVESVALDLSREPARAVLEALLERADVLLESFRPGALARWGLAPESLRRRFPRLVICSLSGWGQEGPHAGRAGHDLTYQAVAGSLASTGEIPNLPSADHLGAWSAVSAILALLLERQRTAEGGWIDAALLDAAAHGGLTAWAEESGRAREVGERLALTGRFPAYRLYPARDGRLVALGALEPRFWKRLCAAVGRRDLLRDQRRAAPASSRRVAALVASRTASEWERLFAEHDIPAEPVLAPGEALEHPQVRQREMLRRDSRGLPDLAFPALLDGRRPRSPQGVPRLGEQTAAVLGELGIEAPRPGEKRRSGIGRRPSWRHLLARLVRR